MISGLAAFSTGLGTSADRCEQMLDVVEGDLSPADRNTIRNYPKEDLPLLHFGWGMGIRNQYLWDGNPP